MYGTTFAVASMDATPGYPAPERACMVVTSTRVMPNGFMGPSAMVSATVEQFGLVTISPFQPRLRCCSGTIFR